MPEQENTAVRSDEIVDRDPSFPARTTGDPAEILRFATEAAQTLRDDKCTDLVILDVRTTSPVTDFIIIGTGTSDRQMRSALTGVKHLGELHGHEALNTHRDENATWLLADYVDLVVHLFEPNARAHYDLELLWGDAPRIEIPDGPGPIAQQRIDAGGNA